MIAEAADYLDDACRLLNILRDRPACARQGEHDCPCDCAGEAAEREATALLKVLGVIK